MSLTKKFVITTLVIGVVSFLAAPNGPLGAAIWPEPNHDVEPSASLLPLFILLGVIESLAFGFGVAYWFFGRGISTKVFGTGTLPLLAHISVGFITANFWLHDNLHIINGLNMTGLAVIDYLFHVPLMAAGLLIVVAAAKAGGAPAAEPQGQAAPA